MATREYQEANRPEPTPFDPAAAQARQAALTEEHTRLLRNPSANFARIRQIRTEIQQLDAELHQHAKQTATARAQQFAPEVQALQSDLQSLTSEYSQLLREPTKNARRIADIKAEIGKRTARQAAIESGEADAGLQWKG